MLGLAGYFAAACNQPQMSIACLIAYIEEYDTQLLYVNVWEWVNLLIFGVFIDDDDY